MLNDIVKRVFGTSHEREVKRQRPRVARINDMEPKWKARSDAELRGKTAQFRTRLDNGEKLDALLEEAFAR